MTTQSSSGPLLTDERLRYWLDSNQAHRERLCLAVLALHPRYSEVTPRRPRGGPDGGRDIEAVLDRSIETWVAVGFQNSVHDTPSEKKAVYKKFKDDLKSALQQNPNLRSFAFFTNVDLTPLEEQQLIEFSKKMHLHHTEIFTRERMRISLDSPEGLGFRYQYLNIPLSEAEQAAFFARFGSNLEAIILDKFNLIDAKLSQIEFLHARTDKIKIIGLEIDFHQFIDIGSLEHFRLCIDIQDPYSTKRNGILFQVRDNKIKIPHRNATVNYPAIDILFAARNPYREYHRDASFFSSTKKKQIGLYFYCETDIPFTYLHNLNHKWVHIFATQNIISTSATFRLICNEHSIFELNTNEVSALAHPFNNLVSDPRWDLFLSNQDLSTPWMLLGPPKSSLASNKIGSEINDMISFWEIDFSRFSPKKYDGIYAKDLAHINVDTKSGNDQIKFVANEYDLELEHPV